MSHRLKRDIYLGDLPILFSDSKREQKLNIHNCMNSLIIWFLFLTLLTLFVLLEYNSKSNTNFEQNPLRLLKKCFKPQININFRMKSLTINFVKFLIQIQTS